MNWLKRILRKLAGDRKKERVSYPERSEQSISSGEAQIGSQGQSESAASQVNAAMAEIRKAGSKDDRHYTDEVDLVKQLKREGRHQEAIEVLLKAVGLTESETDFAGEEWGVAPWYYEQLAIIYRKEKKYDKEVEILERYEKQPKAPGVSPEKLAQRLIKARELLSKSQKQ